MSDISNIKLASGIYNIKDTVARNVTNNILFIKNLGAKGDGTTDDTQAIQNAINNNPHKTLIFEEGNYLISAPLQIYEDNDSQVDLHFESGSRLFTNSQISSLIEIGKVKTGSASHWTRYQLGDIVTISGSGILDGANTQQAIYISANRKFNRLIGLNIVNCDNIGINLDSATIEDVNNSMDSQFLNLNVSGKGLVSSSSIGFKLKASDNEFNEIRLQRFLIGFQLFGGGNIIDNVHMTEGFTNNIVENFNQAVGFDFEGTGFDTLNNIYVDTFGTAFKFNANNKYTVLNNIFTFYYFNQAQSVTSIFKFMQACRINVSNSRFTLTNSGTNRIVDLTNIKDNNFRKNFMTYNYINFSNCTTYHSVIELTDPYNAMQMRGVNSVSLETVAYTTRMTQNAWYPLALIRNGAYTFKLSMENSEIVEVNLFIPTTGTPTIETKSIHSEGSHADDWNLGIAEGFTDDGLRYCYLVVQSKITNLHYNPTIFDVDKNFLNLIYTYPEFMNNTAMSSPNILVQTPLNQ